MNDFAVGLTKNESFVGFQEFFCFIKIFSCKFLIKWAEYTYVCPFEIDYVWLDEIFFRKVFFQFLTILFETSKKKQSLNASENSAYLGGKIEILHWII